MFPTHEFTFVQCISEQPYDHKPTEEECKKIIFRPREVTINGLLDFACHGGVFSPTCRSTTSDGSFHIKAKTDDNFVSSSTVFFDFDKMSTPMHEFVERLNYKPSFGYTSYNNGLDGYRFRLGYVFQKPVIGSQNYRELYVAICTANDFPIETKFTGGLDKRTEAQCYFGTRADADTYYGGYMYALRDFNDYRCAELTQRFFVSSTSSSPSSTIAKNISTDINPEFLTDFNTLSTRDFVAKYSSTYAPGHFRSLSTSLLLDDSQMFYTYPDYYTAVTHRREGRYQLKWDIGTGRKNKIFWTAQIMLYNKPDLTIENLLYNLRLERDWYYVNKDNLISNQHLIRVAQRAMIVRYQPNQTKHGQFKTNSEFWEGQGIGAHAAANHVRGYLNAQRLIPYIDPNLSINENINRLREQGITLREGKAVSKNTLKRMVTKGYIQINNTPPPNTDLFGCSDVVTIQDKPIVTGILHLIRTDGTITQKAMAEALEVDIRTIKRYIDEMKGSLIRREGNNRSGRWVEI